MGWLDVWVGVGCCVADIFWGVGWDDGFVGLCRLISSVVWAWAGERQGTSYLTMSDMKEQ
eukprot:573212-Prorocentrum_lima.AAC.1